MALLVFPRSPAKNQIFGIANGEKFQADLRGIKFGLISYALCLDAAP